MLSVFWDTKGIIMWELLPKNKCIDATFYQQQLAEMRPERRRVVLLHDNAPAYKAKLTRQKLLEQGWEVLPHPQYSPDLAPTDYHLFAALKRFMARKEFADEDDLKARLTNFSEGQRPDFYTRGIRSLHTRWQRVIESDGDYIED